jgi:hypothetical protein
MSFAIHWATWPTLSLVSLGTASGRCSGITTRSSLHSSVHSSARFSFIFSFFWDSVKGNLFWLYM